MTRRSTVSYSKDAERRVRDVMGGRRLRAGEWNGPGDIDNCSAKSPETSWWVSQTKHIKGTPQWLSKGMNQAVEAAESLKGRPLPLLMILTKPGTGNTAEMFVVCRAEDFVDWNGKGDCDD